MRRALIASAIIILAASTADAQGLPARPRMTQDSANVVTLTRLEELWSIAIMRRDRAAFERTLAQKFIYTKNDTLVERPDYINDLLTPPENILDAHTDSVQVHVFGNTGVTTGWRVIAGRAGAAGFERRVRFTDVWMPRNGTWQMIAAHDYVAPLVRK